MKIYEGIASQDDETEIAAAHYCHLTNIPGRIEHSCRDCNKNRKFKGEKYPNRDKQAFLPKNEVITILKKTPQHLTTQTKQYQTTRCAPNGFFHDENETIVPVVAILHEGQQAQFKRPSKEIQRSISKRYQPICRNGRHYRSKFGHQRRSASLLVKYITIWFCLVIAKCENVSVTWEMKSNLVEFGETAKLMCQIRTPTELCHTFYLQWYGGQNHKLLCRNTICRNPEKYYEVEEAACNFTLKIYNFSESDVNCDYSCYYGTSYERKMLALDEQHFAYVPNTQDILHRHKTVSNLTDLVKYFQVVIELTKVYPVPVCNITFQEENISRFVDVLKRNNGIFYSMIFNISYSTSICSGKFKMQCVIGNTLIIPFAENVTLCSVGKESTEHHVLSTILIGAIAVLVFIVIIVLVLKKRRRPESYREDIKYGNLECLRSNNDQRFKEEKENGTCSTGI